MGLLSQLMPTEGHSVVFLTEMQFAHRSVGSVLSRRNLNAIEGVEASGVFENQ